MAIEKLNILLKQPQKLFHTADLAVLWNIQNSNTLYTAIKRFTKREVLFSVQKGLYSVLPLAQLEAVQLGVKILHRYAYLSTETVLAKEGLISQIAYPITFVSGISRTWQIGQTNFLSRKLKMKFLYNTAGVFDRGDGILQAGAERAVADMLYFQPNYHFDGASLIDWDKVKEIKRKVGYL